MSSCWLVVIGIVVAVVISLRYAWWRSRIDYACPRILMYHMINEHLNGGRFNKLRVTPKAFERQVKWLADQGWSFGSMSDLTSEKPVDEKTVFITFDDGYRDNILNAHPVLERYGAKATLYLVVERFDRDWSSYKKAHHDTGELMREQKLSDKEVELLLESGRWEIGGHTITHANLLKLEDSRRIEEICQGKSSLEERFGVDVSSFAFPFGIYDRSDIDRVRECGFSSAVTTENGVDANYREHIFELKRIKVSGKDSLLSFILKIKNGKRGLRK